MTTKRIVVLCSFLAIPLLLTGIVNGGDKKKPKNDACAAGSSQNICNAENTCGSAGSPCQINIKRVGGTSASATPNIPHAKSNDAFCVKVGTTVTFRSESKDTGFVLDFGSSSPFDGGGGAIMGGADRPISVVAKKPGCYTYTVGACTAGTIYGMCGEDAAQVVVSAN